MPSGGRRRNTWTKHTRPKGGRKKGAKDKVPRSWKGSLEALFSEYGKAHPDELWKAFDRGVKAKPPKSIQYLNLMAGFDKNKDAWPSARVLQLVLSMMSLFLQVVEDHEQRQRFAEGVRRLTGVATTKAIDAEPQ